MPLVVCTLLWGGSLAVCGLGGGRVFVAVSTTAFAVVGCLLGSHAAIAAEQTTVRRWFDDRQRQEGLVDAVIVEGRLRRDAIRTDYGAQLQLDVERLYLDGRQAEMSGGLRVAVGGTLTEEARSRWVAGRRVRMPVSLRRTPRYLNPGTADQDRRAAWRGVALLGSVKSALLVEVTGRGSWGQEMAAQARAVVRRTIHDAVGTHSLRSAGVVTAVLIGDRAGLDRDTQRRLQEGGTFHVIAISGGNIAILTGVLLLTLRLGGVPSRVASVLAIVCLLGYWQVVGFEASVSRATLAASLFLAARVADHRPSALNTLALSAICLVATNPLTLADPGFLLTYGATLGILVGVPRLLVPVMSRCEPFGVVGSYLLGPLAGLFAATVCAELVLLPVAASAFSRVTAAGLVLNFAAIPLMTVTQVAGMATVGAAGFSEALAEACGYVAHLATVGITASAYLVDVAPQLSQRVAPPGAVAASLYYMGLVGLVAGPGRTTKVSGLVVVFGMGVVIILGPIRVGTRPVDCPGMSRALRVVVLDVDQADATLVQFPTGHSMLVDAAGSVHGPSVIGERVVAPALWSAGVRRLDYLVLTHGDPDHAGGAEAVLHDFTPREVWEGVPVSGSVRLQRLKAIARDHAVAWRTVQTGDVVEIGDVRVTVWHPPAAEWERPRVRNDDSLVLEIRHGDVSFVLPGDIGSAVEASLLERRRPAGPVVLKVPHHGSQTSSSAVFVEALQPTVAIVSAGRDNRFGHPHEAVMRRYRDAGVRVLETGRDGAVSVCSDGQRIQVGIQVEGARSRKVATRSSG